jgi:hypothetical protein
MTQQDPKFVASSRPINQRTAVRQLIRQKPLKPIVRERLEGTKARSRFGLPLAEQIDSLAAKSKRIPLSALTILGSIVSAVSVVCLLLAWIQLSWLFTTTGLLGLLAGLGLVIREHRLRIPANLAVSSEPFFDNSSLQKFDSMMEKIALEVPENIALQLGEVKQLIVRISRQASAVAADENFTMDDRMYVIESVRRYLPDTLQSYLLIPSQQRTVVAIDGQHTAATLLGHQLSLIQVELKKCESRITKSTAENLLRQQRFLESKRS